jgi:murein DD-endopeptidase MepM/ murein hydrolase activator NlpD
MIRYYPIAGAPRNICAGYGNRTSGGVTKLHDACDLCAPLGTPVIAVDDGVVTYGLDAMGGNTAVLRIADTTGYYYAHLRDAQSGQRTVRAGEQIAVIGKTGNAAPAGIPSHTHFQQWIGGVFGPPGTVHPDPTAALMAATVLAAPLGGAVASRAGTIAAAVFGFSALVGLTYASLYAWNRWRT